MDFNAVIEGRCSVRHYTVDAVPSDAEITAIINQAAWAPSPGNTQPWKVTVLSQGRAEEFITQFELAGWEYVLCTVRKLIRTVFKKDQAISNQQLNEEAFALFSQHIQAKGAPRVLLIHYRKTPFSEYLGLCKDAVHMSAWRFWQKKTVAEKFGYLWHMASGIMKTFKVDQNTIYASVSMFAYGITLAAHQQGWTSCIQFTYNHLDGELKKFLDLPSSDRIWGVILLGAQAPDAKNMPRSRREVNIRFQ